MGSDDESHSAAQKAEQASDGESQSNVPKAESPKDGSEDESESRAPQEKPDAEEAKTEKNEVEESYPSKAEIDDFLKANNVDERASADLRDASRAVQKAVLARGDLSTARNPSAALLVRIRDAKLGGGGGGGGGTGVGMGLPKSSDIDAFIKRNGIDRKTGDSFRSSSPTIKRIVLASGDLGPVPDPSATLQQRMSAARTGGASSIVPATMKFPTLQEVDDFLAGNEVDTSSADQLRNCPPAVQRVVLSRGDLRSARNPSSALLARIRDAKASPEGQGVMPGMSGMGYPMYPPMGFAPPPGGFPPPPGYGMYPGMYPGYPGYGYPGYPAPSYQGYPGGAYAGYPSAAPPAQELSQPEQSGARGRSCSSSYSYSYTPSPSPARRKRSRSRSRRPVKAKRAAGGRAGKPKPSKTKRR